MNETLNSISAFLTAFKFQFTPSIIFQIQLKSQFFFLFLLLIHEFAIK